MLSWDCNKQEVIERVNRLEFSDFIVAVKNKNEGEVLRQWLDHYIEAFGAKSVILFDNGSDDDYTKDIISSYENQLGLAMEYSNLGYDHNVIHNTKIFNDLYLAIKDKCKYFALFDADEILVFFDGKAVVKNEFLLKKLRGIAKKTNYSSLIFCHWLMAKQGSMHEFEVPHDVRNLFSGVKNGKYFIPSSRLGDVFLSHSHSCPSDLVGYFSTQSLWLLHYQQSDIERRIRVNYEKIKSRNMFKQGVGVSDVIAKPNLDMLKNQDNKTATSHMKQICRLAGVLGGKEEAQVAKKSGFCSLHEDGGVEFSDLDSEITFSEFLSGFYSAHEYAYFKSGLSRFFRHTRMIDLCVFGQVENSGDGKIRGWVFDLVASGAPTVGFFYRGQLFHSINLSGEFSCFIEGNEVLGGFEIDISVLKEKAAGLSVEPSRSFHISVKHMRTMNSLHNGNIKAC